MAVITTQHLLRFGRLYLVESHMLGGKESGVSNENIDKSVVMRVRRSNRVLEGRNCKCV